MAIDLPALRALAGTQRGLVTTAQVVALGMSPSSITAQVTAGQWRRIHRSVYLIEPDLAPDPLPFHTRLLAARLRHGDDTVAVLQTAGTLHDLLGMPGDPNIHLARRPNGERHQVPEIGLHTLKLRPDEVTTSPSGLVTTLLRTLTDLVLEADRPHAVSLLDAALNRGQISATELAAVEAAFFGRKGAIDARSYLREVDGRAQSPLETRVRLTATDVGLPPDELQVAVVSRSGALLGYGDLGWRLPSGGWLVGECDGASVHDTPQAVFYDRGRANAFWVEAGVPIIRFTWRDWDRHAYVRWLIQNGAKPTA
jgi:hypothetical protein